VFDSNDAVTVQIVGELQKLSHEDRQVVLAFVQRKPNFFNRARRVAISVRGKVHLAMVQVALDKVVDLLFIVELKLHPITAG
jgi:hypothetical protein